MSNSAPVAIVIPTFMRHSKLLNIVDALAELDGLVRDVYVIDNGRSSELQSTLLGQGRGEALEIHYVMARENLGPAGATAYAMRQLTSRAAPADWLMRLDDDWVPDPQELRHVISSAFAIRERFPSAAAVGLRGARWGVGRLRLSAVPPLEHRPVQVDYLKTGFAPMFHVDAMRSVGPFRDELFFGMTEVEYGSRLSRGGYTQWEIEPAAKVEPGRSLTARSAKPSRSAQYGWRRYYSVRNHVTLLREEGRRFTAAGVALARAVIGPMKLLPSDPKLLLQAWRLGIRGARDAYLGRLGLTLDPWTSALDEVGSDARLRGELPHT